MLSKREREFIEDWLRVRRGEMEELEFYIKWGTASYGRSFAEDVDALKKGEITPEQFRLRWSRGEWKVYVRQMRYRLRKKLERARSDLMLLKEFFSGELP
jgi:hypothetical protein